MQIIINADNAEIRDGKIIISYDGSKTLPFDMGFRIKTNDGSTLMDDGWIRVTKNHTLNLQRIK